MILESLSEALLRPLNLAALLITATKVVEGKADSLPEGLVLEFFKHLEDTGKQFLACFVLLLVQQAHSVLVEDFRNRNNVFS